MCSSLYTRKRGWMSHCVNALRTRRIGLGTGVTCPILRYHPSIIAQAAVTLSSLVPGRVYLGLGTGEKPGDFPPERCKDLLRIASGMPEIEIEIKSILPWQSAVRVVDGFQQGRVFLAGDAAHQMPPWGGQGAKDAHNLAWKLAAVLKGQAAPALLATYDSERQPVGRRAAEESGQSAADNGSLLRVLVTTQQGVPGDAVPWPEREVSSHHSLFFIAAAGGKRRAPE